jgi:MFS transporter, DHA1 family, multidrug resistance protein
VLSFNISCNTVVQIACVGLCCEWICVFLNKDRRLGAKMRDKKQHKYFLAAIVLMIIPISGLAIDIYVPSLPAVANYFSITNKLAQLTITTYMIGLGLMQLVAGSIADSYGRRLPYVIAMSIFILATLLIPFSQSISQLLVLRFVQGMSVALTVVPIRSVISDLFEGKDLQKMLTYLTIAWSIGPIIAPALGGYLQQYLGWKSNFYFLAGYSTLIFIVSLVYLPETTLFKHPFLLKETLKRYTGMLGNTVFLSGLLMDGLLYSLLILFSVIGPFLVQKQLGYSSIVYGHVSLLLGFSWFLGNILNRFLIDVSLYLKVQTALWIILLMIVMMLLLTHYVALDLNSIIPPLVIIFLCGGLIFPNYFTRAIHVYRESSAGAGAIFSSFVFFIASLGSYLGSLLPANNIIPMGMIYLLLTLMCIIIFYVDTWKQKQH